MPVAVIRRFDRDEVDGRIPYQSAASLLQALREAERSYTEIADAIRSHGHAHAAVSNWRRLALGPEVGLRAADLDDFAPAFEHEQREAAAALLGLSPRS